MNKTLEGYLIIADITGYTMYLSQSELDHAQEILTTLLELLLNHTRPPLVLSRLAGDAVISYGVRGSFINGQTFLEIIDNTYAAFRKAIDQMVMNNTCQCQACANISALDLKFFVHYGPFAIQRISDHDELVGSDVNLIHRLLKNHVTEKTGFHAYTLYTDTAIRQLGMDGLCDRMIPLEESYEHLGTVKVWVQDMHPVWQEKRAALRVEIPPEQILLNWEIDIALPPEVIWDYLSDPEYRNLLFGSQRQEVSNRKYGRVTTGTVYECVHGSRTTSLTILEWQPFERIVFFCPLPVPGATMLSELLLSKTAEGTRLNQIYNRAKGPLPMRIVSNMALKGMYKQGLKDLIAFKDRVEADYAHGQVVSV